MRMPLASGLYVASPRLAPSLRRRWRDLSGTGRDVYLIALGCLILFAALSWADVFGAFAAFVTTHKDWQLLLDELLTAAFVVPLGIAVYAVRRQRELRREIARRNTAEAEARRLALHDPLTGLPNRRLLAEQGLALLARARREGAAVAVLVLDLDRFKPVNDLHGHAAGDAVLREVAGRLLGILREGDTVARTGGDEFVVAAQLGGADAGEAAARLARRIVAAIGESVVLEGGEVATIGVSVGIALAEPRGVAEFGAVLRQADAALYGAKAEGRGTFRFHEAGMDAARRERARVETALRRAIPAGEIEPHYQPLVDLGTGLVEGFEVLARWRHPERGLLLPSEFIPLAEEAGLIGPLTEAVLRQAAVDATSWEDPLPIAVNLSALLLHDTDLPGRVLRILAEAGLPPERLEVEVTETAVAANQDRARRVAEVLKAVGVRLAMDDFGTGYSSLASLRALPFDRIKIDRSFIAALSADGESKKIVAAIVALGRSLGLPTVAEGVENAAAARQVAALGCHVGQGWYFAHPVPAAEVAALLAASAPAPSAGAEQCPPSRTDIRASSGGRLTTSFSMRAMPIPVARSKSA